MSFGCTLAVLVAATTASGAMPLRYVDRPLTPPEDWFVLNGDALFGAFGPEQAAVGIDAGASYGIDDDFEIGINLLRLILSSAPDTGLSNPIGFLQYRVLRGPLEIGLGVESEVPINRAWAVAGRISFLARIAGIFRIDFRPAIGATLINNWAGSAILPLELRAQLVDKFSIGALVQAELPDFKAGAVLLRYGGRVALTIGEKEAADAELALAVLAPNHALRREAPSDPWLGNYPTVFFTVRVFMDNPNDPSPPGWNEL